MQLIIKKHATKLFLSNKVAITFTRKFNGFSRIKEITGDTFYNLGFAQIHKTWT